ncbi:MAG: hypothetical protein H7203_07460 [Rhizobacter sp.]|nr:hypothetical protein [Burkholderiales bacterium]
MPTLFQQYTFDRGKFAAIDYAASSAFFRKALRFSLHETELSTRVRRRI